MGRGQSAAGQRAFRWSAATGMTDLGKLAGGTGNFSIALGVSANGLVVVGNSDSTPGTQAFMWTAAGGMVGLGDLPGTTFSSVANGVSADGLVIVGQSRSASGPEAYRWTAAGGMVGLGDLAGSLFSSTAIAASADGSVIVGQARSSSGSEAFRWTAATGMQGLGDLPGGSFSSVANAVSADGLTVVGRSNVVPTVPGDAAFIWDQAHGMRNLRNVLISDFGLNLTGWTLSSATGVSADGKQIAGFGTNPSGGSEGWFADLSTPTAAVPEPSSLIVWGLVSLVAALRSRRLFRCNGTSKLRRATP